MKKILFKVCQSIAYIFIFFYGKSILEDKEVLKQEKKIRKEIDALARK